MLHSIMLPFCLRSSGRPGTEAAAKARQLITATGCSSLRRAPSSGGLGRGCGEGRGVGGGRGLASSSPLEEQRCQCWQEPGTVLGAGPEMEEREKSSSGC